jgi:hypothetical protein
VSGEPRGGSGRRMTDEELHALLERVAGSLPDVGGKNGNGESKMKLAAIAVVLAAASLFATWVWNPNVKAMDEMRQEQRTSSAKLEAALTTLTTSVASFQVTTAAALANHEARLENSERLLWTTKGNPAAPARQYPPDIAP